MQELLDSRILTIIIFTPTLGALLLMFVGRNRESLIRSITLAFTLITFVFSFHIIRYFDNETGNFQFLESLPWIPSIGINYQIGVDGVSLLLILLTTVLTPLAVLASSSIKYSVKEYFVFLLLLETGMIGVFAALDLFLFYVFWEVVLIPMYFVIGIWGGKRRIYAATKFLLYTMAGSVLMLVAILGLYFVQLEQTGLYSFSYLDILNSLSSGSLELTPTIEFWLFLAFFLAFAIKVPIFPLHTWLPDAHVEAPTAGSVLLAGILLKMGTYGLIRFSLPFFPSVSQLLAPLISILAIVGIIYGALVAMVQPDIKKLVAYSSVSHLGFVVLGIFGFTTIGIEGAVYQMLSHGVSTGALFLLVGILYERRHTHLIADYGGVAHRMPIFSALFLLVVLASIGLPGLNGFVGEFLILLGTFGNNPSYAVFAALGVILSAVYMLWMYQRTIFGKITHPDNEKLVDINLREVVMLLPLTVLIVWMGVYSSSFLRPMDATIERLVTQMEARQVKLAINPKSQPISFWNGSIDIQLPALEVKDEISHLSDNIGGSAQ